MLMDNIHLEALLAAGYALFLLMVSLGIELLARFSHHRIQRVKTIGFRYHQHANAWQCSAGNFLWLHEVDHEKRLARYRARPDVCNQCSIKSTCTDSNEGRELLHSLDKWPYTEIGRFQRGISLTLILLAVFLLGFEIIRHHHGQNELFLLGTNLLLVLMLGWRILAKFRASRTNVPSASDDRLAMTHFRIDFNVAIHDKLR